MTDAINRSRPPLLSLSTQADCNATAGLHTYLATIGQGLAALLDMQWTGEESGVDGTSRFTHDVSQVRVAVGPAGVAVGFASPDPRDNDGYVTVTLPLGLDPTVYAHLANALAVAPYPIAQAHADDVATRDTATPADAPTEQTATSRFEAARARAIQGN